jgi:hypothetical protein
MTDIVIRPERAGEETATRDRAFRVNSLGPAIPATGTVTRAPSTHRGHRRPSAPRRT